MQVEEELAQFSPKKDMMLAIGVFDGVHLGHKHLLSQLRERARREDWLSGVITFRQHPQAVLSPRTKLPCLTDLAQRVKLLKNEGIDAVITLSFTPELAQLGTRQFIELLRKYLRMRGLVIGPDFALGRSREGDINTLRTLGQELDFSVAVVPPLVINSEVVSSTAIRNALAEGNMKIVDNLIGRPFSLHGRVITGVGRGAELGFPTANLDVDPQQALPPDGVYATWAYIDDSAYVYLLDYHGDLYGQELRIDIIERLRNEERFDTVDELKKQVVEDVKQGRAIFNSVREQVKK